ncbi:GTP cyclohydrolase 1 type 2 [Rubripirellula obstinata]|uniref:GTP cyclohydrolase 1 type 2 homolog n=1 Tax=Rubripirellula obstinata TaxID=406547 RepID=A0A5B1CTL1_9BACT|nr:GTP cyclohydrolase 1 type 2 [Rubripirellula obstinata]
MTPGESLGRICSVLAQIAPLRLAEDWDNVGLLVGDRGADVSRAMTCLTITPDVVKEAVESKVDLIIAHHPLPFKPLAKLTTDTVPGTMLLGLASHKIAVYSAHTAFDSAADGINNQWAKLIGIDDSLPLITSENGSGGVSEGRVNEGSGRMGRFESPRSLGQIVKQAADAVGQPSARIVGSPDLSVSKVAIACGSGGSFLAAAKRQGCDMLLTGEATFHTCLEARSLGIGLGLLGHYHSERFAMERLAKQLADEVDAIEVWASKVESDPVQML